MAIETCGDAIYKKAILRHSPPDVFDPINWNGDDWRGYIETHVLRSSAVSIALCGLVVAALIFYLGWRMVKLCWCASHSSNPYQDLTSRWLLVQKCLVVTLGVLAITGAIVGMVMVEHDPVGSVRVHAQFAFSYADRVLDSVDSLLTDARAVVPALGSARSVLSEANTPLIVSSMQCIQQLLDSVPSVVVTRAALVAMDAVVNPNFRDSIGAVTQLMGNATLQLAPALASMYGADALFLQIFSTIVGYSQELMLLPTDELASSSPQFVRLAGLQAAQETLDRNSATWDASLSDLTAAIQFYTAYKQSNPLLLLAAQARQLLSLADYLRLDLLPPLSSALRSFNNLCSPWDTGCFNDAITAINIVNTTVVHLDGGIASALSQVGDMRAQAWPLCNIGSSSYSDSRNLSIDELSWEFDNLAQSLAATDELANMSSMAEEAGSAISGGPDVTSLLESFLPQLQSTLRQLQPLAADVASATNNVLSAPTVSTYAALLVAVDTARSAVVYLGDEMADVQQSSFITWARNLNGSLDVVNSMDSAMGGLQEELMLVQEHLSPAPIGSYPESIQPFLDALDSVTALDDLPQPKSQVLTAAISTTQSLDVDLTTALLDIQQGVNNTISSFGDDSLRQLRSGLGEARHLEALYVGTGQHYYYKYGWQIWLGVYGAFIGMVLLVMLFSVLSCPGVLCATLPLLLAYLITFMIVPIGLTSGAFMLQDGCWQAEVIALREAAGDPHIDALVQFYLLGRIDSLDSRNDSLDGKNDSLDGRNNSLEAVLLQAGGISIPKVRQSQYAAHDWIQNVTSNWTPGWKLAPAVDAIRGAVEQVQAQLDVVLAAADFEPVHDAYVQLKASACCHPGDFLFTHVLCMTVSGMVCLAMILTSFFIVWKLDGVRGQSKCCGCQCYRAEDYKDCPDPEWVQAGVVSSYKPSFEGPPLPPETGGVLRSA